MAGIDRLRTLVSASKRLVAFTGAGISAASGIPTYRGPDGVWRRYDPARYANLSHFLEDPSYYWSFFRDVRYPGLEKAMPNTAHLALAELEKHGVLRAVITQNIDGLHQLAGSVRVIELHGNTRRIACMKCGAEFSMEEVYRQLSMRLPPLCPQCGGGLKPQVVFFGESLPPAALEEAVQESRGCDLFLVVGSSLVVQPAASLPGIAAQAGASLVIVNLEPTPLDGIADLVIRESASDVLPAVL